MCEVWFKLLQVENPVIPDDDASWLPHSCIQQHIPVCSWHFQVVIYMNVVASFTAAVLLLIETEKWYLHQER